ncbi:MAG: Fe-S cluster assembly sulfur transfer protein SufU [Candidatus Zixiibacteriota bacterium]
MNTPEHTHDVELDALYRDTVLDHFRAPRGHKVLDRIDLVREGHNPVCGDRLTMSVKLAGNAIEDVAVHCKGCAISVASASMLAEMLPGMSIQEAQRLAEAFRQMMHGQPPPSDLDIGDLDALEGVKNFPVRVKCALLAWMTLIDALRAAESGTNSTTGITNLEQPGN